jgi:hypothetical protein
MNVSDEPTACIFYHENTGIRFLQMLVMSECNLMRVREREGGGGAGMLASWCMTEVGDTAGNTEQSLKQPTNQPTVTLLIPFVDKPKLSNSNHVFVQYHKIMTGLFPSTT